MDLIIKIFDLTNVQCKATNKGNFTLIWSNVSIRASMMNFGSIAWHSCFDQTGCGFFNFGQHQNQRIKPCITVVKIVIRLQVYVYLKINLDLLLIPDFFNVVYDFLWVGSSKCCAVPRANLTNFPAATKPVSLHQLWLIPLVLQSGNRL